MQSLLALSTFPDQEVARTIVRALVEKQLVACGNILPGIESIYRWKGKIESGSETLVLFKLSDSTYDAFERELLSLHPYDVPEVIAFPIERGSGDYLQWIAENSAQLWGDRILPPGKAVPTSVRPLSLGRVVAAAVSGGKTVFKKNRGETRPLHPRCQ